MKLSKVEHSIEPDLLRTLLSDALLGKRAHLSTERAFDGLTWRQTGLVVSNSPHTIWQLLKHLNYWQDRYISRIEGMKVLPAKTSDDGWKFDPAPPDEGTYNRELGKLLTGINYMTQTMLPQINCLKGPMGDYPNGFAVIQSMASHISYHLGEVILLRRMLGIWPPPSGGFTW